MTNKTDLPFWKTKQLWQMTPEEWESLCDGCGKCCLLKVEFEDTGEVEPTTVACKLLDSESCQCSNYGDRFTYVEDCIDLQHADLGALPWLPSTCAYRLIGEGKPLQWWHPLVSGDPDTVHAAGVSVRNKTISEDDLSDESELVHYIVDWKL
ncbi:MAG: YcgN family cysteine cluster protein [Alphaproteobacteria bacterium]|jgi:uncharacterized cysteine cluster protein YcgN (CxxCxxCC family)